MVAFSSKPARTWNTIFKQIIIYKNKSNISYYFKLINEVTAKFQIEDFNDKPLQPVYLLGYSSQIEALRTKKQNKNEENE